MKTFKTGGVKFYMLAAGEPYPDPNADNQYVGAYAIFPYEGKWLAQIHSKGSWLDLTDQRFDTENSAFNYAHDHYLSEQKKLFPLTR